MAGRGRPRVPDKEEVPGSSPRRPTQQHPSSPDLQVLRRASFMIRSEPFRARCARPIGPKHRDQTAVFPFCSSGPAAVGIYGMRWLADVGGGSVVASISMSAERSSPSTVSRPAAVRALTS